MKLTTKQLKKLIKEELSLMLETGSEIRELEEKIEMLAQHAEEQSDGDPVVAEKIFSDLGGDALRAELESLRRSTSPSIGSGLKHEITPMDRGWDS